MYNVIIVVPIISNKTFLFDLVNANNIDTHKTVKTN